MADSLIDESELALANATEIIAEETDLGVADFKVAYLVSEGVPSKSAPSKLRSGVPGSYLVLVNPEQAHRARFLLSESEFTERELAFLATGTPEVDSDT